MSFATRSSFGTFTLTPCRFCRRTSNNIIQKGLAFGRDWSGSVVNSGRWGRSGILPRRPDGRGGASVVRCRRRFNRTEDLDVKVSKEALSSAIRSGWCSKGPATGHGRPQGQERRTGLEAIARHCHAAITRGGDDFRHDAGDWLAAALCALLPCRRGAPAPQAQAWLEEGGRDPGVPGYNRRQREAQRSSL